MCSGALDLRRRGGFECRQSGSVALRSTGSPGLHSGFDFLDCYWSLRLHGFQRHFFELHLLSDYAVCHSLCIAIQTDHSSVFYLYRL